MSHTTVACLREAADAIQAKIGPIDSEVGIVLGSGLSGVVDLIEDARHMPYAQIPHFAHVGVHGHRGELIAGSWSGRRVICMAGRWHRYEGHGYDQVTFGVRLLGALGVRTVVITNAAGSTDASLKPGQLMVIKDHLNLTGWNPLIGPNDDALGPRFVDMTVAYDKHLRRLALETAAEMGIAITEGVYAGLLGPSYETPSEIHMMRLLGAHAVGMSTVPEVIVARHQGLRVLAISCITNLGAGLSGDPLDHGEVTEVAGRAAAQTARLLGAILPKID